MKQKFKFSIIINNNYTEKELNKSINSIIYQDIGFEENVQIIIVNDGERKSDMALKYKEKYPDNIYVFNRNKEENSIIQSNDKINSDNSLTNEYNSFISNIKGEYVNFMESKDKISDNALSAIVKFIKKYGDVNILCLPIMYFKEGIEWNHPLNFRFIEEKLINLNKNPEYPQSTIKSSFIKAKSLKEFDLNLDLIYKNSFYSINKLILEEEKIGLVTERYYYYRKYEDNELDLNFIFNRLDCLKNLIRYSIDKKGKLPKYIQYTIVYGLIFLINLNDLSDFNSENKKILFDRIKDILTCIDEDVIKHRKVIKDINFRRFLIYLKNDEEFHIETEKERSRIFLKTNDFVINRIHKHNIYFDIIEIKNGILYLSGSYVSLCNNDSLKIEAIKTSSKGKKVFEGKYVEYPTTKRATVKYLGIPWKYFYNFDFEIPINENDNYKLNFNMIYEENGKKIRMKNGIKFRYHANLSRLSNYLIKDSSIVLFGGKTFNILPYSYGKVIKFELKTFLRILKYREENFLKAILFRLLILILTPFMINKRIWIFQDRIDVADDNAKHLFKYSIKQDDNIKKYYIIDKKCNDYDEMLKIDKNIVNFYSLKHKVLYCFAEKVISSHCNQSWLNPFFDHNFRLYTGLVTVQRCFLQHGVTKDDVSWWFRKFYQNFHLLLTTSDLERDSMLSENYNYRDEVVQSLGFPRFDNLNNENLKKQILFMPTWRKNLKTEEDFINSDFYDSLNGFFNDEELLKIVKENDYKILFKPHWNLLPFLDSFDIDEAVEIMEDVPYQKLFNESSLLITDYSSVAFDFAYLKKPVIYLQETKYHYEEGYFKYDTMGFGDVVKSKEELVSSVIKQIKNECKMEDKYKERVDSFFKYNDKNNCKRNYNWLLKNK